MKLRNAQSADAAMLFDWANDPDVRRMAFGSDTIDWHSHMAWFESRLRDPGSRIYVAEVDDDPVGQIRFDVMNQSAVEVDIHMRPGFKGKNLGTEIIIRGVARVFSELPIKTVHAVIKEENKRSLRAFEKAGFRELQRKRVMDQECIEMVHDCAP